MFEAVPSDNPRNVSKIAGYLTACKNCGDLIYVRFKVESLCLHCQARKLIKGGVEKFNKFYRSGAWRRARKLVFDLKGRVCAYCGKPATHVDHKDPISRGGTNEMGNLQPVCGSCNVKKFKMTDREFRDKKGNSEWKKSLPQAPRR